MSGRKDRFPPTSQHKRPWLWSLGEAGEAKGLQPALEGAWCLTWLMVDSTRLGEVGTNSLCITAAKAKPGPAGQKGWDRALVKDTLSRMALGPGGRTGKALARELPATLQGRKGHEESRSSLLLGPKETKHPFLYGFSPTSGGGGALLGSQRGGSGWAWWAETDLVHGPEPWTEGTLPESRQAGEAAGCCPDSAFPHSALEGNSVPSFFGEKQVVVSRRVQGLRGYLAQGYCSQGPSTLTPP